MTERAGRRWEDKHDRKRGDGGKMSSTERKIVHP